MDPLRDYALMNPHVNAAANYGPIGETIHCATGGPGTGVFEWIEELHKDKARLDWLDEHTPRSIALTETEEDGTGYLDWGGPLIARTLREAIDDAMADK